MENVTIMDHPLIKHKISRLRDETTGTNEFRALVEEIAMLMGYEALSDLPTEEVEVKTPIETCKTPVIAGRKLAVVPILRAGLGMVRLPRKRRPAGMRLSSLPYRSEFPPPHTECRTDASFHRHSRLC